MAVVVTIRGPVVSVGLLAERIRAELRRFVVKYRVKEDVSFSIGTDPERTIKAGVHEVSEKDRETYEYLERAGLAEPVKTPSKEG